MSENKNNSDIQTNVKLNALFGGICCCFTSCGCCYSICSGSVVMSFTKKHCFKLMLGLSSVIALTEACIVGKHYQNIFPYNALIGLLLADIMSIFGYNTFPTNSFDVVKTTLPVHTEEVTEIDNNISQIELTKTNHYVTFFLFAKAIIYFFINISVIATTKPSNIIHNTFIFELVYNILLFFPVHYVNYLNHKINNNNNYYTTIVNIIKIIFNK
jgi:hypothetical protein